VSTESVSSLDEEPENVADWILLSVVVVLPVKLCNGVPDIESDWKVLFVFESDVKTESLWVAVSV